VEALSIRPGAIPYETRITPESRGLQIRPPEPTGTDASSDYLTAGRSYWKGWICKTCGCANDRRSWDTWECEACEVSLANPKSVRSCIDVGSLWYRLVYILRARHIPSVSYDHPYGQYARAHDRKMVSQSLVERLPSLGVCLMIISRL
jgi:hypothetical protein